MSLASDKVFFLDLQTTGAKPPTARILEMAWATSQAEEVLCFLLKQEHPIPRPIQALTGILAEDLQSALELTEVFSKLHQRLQSSENENTYVIIHFAQFEKKFLEDAYDKMGIPCPFQILCTHEIAKRLLPNLPTRGIKGLAGYFGYPSTDFKRATQQILATKTIWQGLIPLLEEKGLKNLADIAIWLQEKQKATRGKYEYPLAKEKRLSLPKKPGIYRMISRWGEVLYVGKATSLHDRVNSYFRGQKNRDSRKLEMLTQVWDLRVTPVETPLEAALLETDEIKRLNPRYNISLKMGHRELAFFSRDFTSVCSKCDSEHPVGPFPNALTLDSMLRLRKTLVTGVWDEKMFFDPFPADLIAAGFGVFCERHHFEAEAFTNFRNILAVGLNWYRKIKEFEPEDEEALKKEIFEEAVESVLPSFDELSQKISLQNCSLEELLLDQDEAESESKSESKVEITSEDIADKFERHFTRAAAAYARGKRMTKLLNSHLEIKKGHFLNIQNGFVLEASANWAPQKGNWQGHSIETYDRMSVLLSELNKIKDL